MPEGTQSPTAYDSGAYCDTGAGGVAAINGADVLLGLFNADGSKLLAVSGEKDHKISLSADTTSVSSKDVKGAWKIQRTSTRSFEVSVDTIVVKDAESDKLIRQAFEEGTALCVKEFYDDKDFTPIGGGSVYVTKYEADSPSDDVRTASVSLSGSGKWTWFDINEAAKAKAIAKPSNRTAAK